MAAPTAAFPLSPSPQSPLFPSDLTSTPPHPHPSAIDEHRRQNKRSSTASQSGRPDLGAAQAAAAHYPSPPMPQGPSNGGGSGGGHRSRSSYDPSLVIPPFNPNKRRSAGGSASSTPPTASRRNSAQQGFAVPVPTTSAAQYQHAHAQRPVSTQAIPQIPPFNPHAHVQQQQQYAQQQQQHYAVQQQQQQQQHHAAPAPQGPGGSVSSRARQSVGYLPTNTSLAGQGPYPHLYNPHPMPRQKIYFGPYILLQTLGEGEFGKVKLGVHSERWGEDVAIKLIKRGNVDTAQRGEKVRREIEVLKLVRHPNIVRLYDVIETEKYIGIVLEYASGGELFDHILAHRYLKERDAARLFAQLISGVSYLHAKGVVHRDLKLENLLLDRNRNVIITDFGFANRFNDPTVDLMATSCGSPCYAAPELVVQDGKYIGTAVDVWSCGVILYAMLAGYLPYDDDPANPEGDNINLLYKYILNTPLTFPEWISEEPRHLLLTMLVPDPSKRCTIRDVTQHSWLRKYAHAFDKSVDELEYQAQEMEMHKRQALEIQRQWLIQQQQQQQLAAQGLLAPSMTRSQTATSSMGMPGPPSASGTAAARHRSAMVTSSSTTAATAPLAQMGFEHYSMASPVSAVPAPAPIAEEPPVAPRTRTTSTASTSSRRPQPPTIVPIPHVSNPSRRSGAYNVSASPPTTATEFVAAEAQPFSFDSTPRSTPSPSPALASAPMVPSLSAPAAPSQPVVSLEDQLMMERSPSASVSASRGEPAVDSLGLSAGVVDEQQQRRRKAAHRATVQVEYVDPAAGASAGSRRREQAPLPLPSPSPLSASVGLSGPVQGLAIHTEEDDEVEEKHERERERERPVVPRLVVPAAGSERESATPSPVPSMGGVSVSTTTETMPGEDVVMHPVEEEEREQEEVTLRVEQPQPPTPVETPLPAPTARPATPPPAIPFPSPDAASPLPTAPSSAAANLSSSTTHLNGTPRKRKSSSSPAPSLVANEHVPALPQPPSADVEATPRAKVSNTSQASEASRAPSAMSTSSRGHRHTASSDRFSIRGLLGGSLPAADRPSRPSSSRAEPSPLGGAESTPFDEVTNRRKTRRQKALSLQPFRNSVSSKLPKQARDNVDAQVAASRTRSSTLQQQQRQPQPAMPPPPVPAVRPTADAAQPGWVRPNAPSAASSSSKRMSTDLEANWSGTAGSTTGPTPSGKAKAVMDWFRRKSTKPDGLAPPIQTDFDDRRYARPPSSTAVEPPASSNASMRSGAVTPTQQPGSAPSPTETIPAAVQQHHQQQASVETTPSLVVTTPRVDSQASSRSASGAYSQLSHSQHGTVSTLGTSVAHSPVAPIASTPLQATAPAFSPAKLRFHQGALDKNAVTYRVPYEVIGEIKTVLWNMGVDMAMEGDYKIKCVRKSKKKAQAAAHRASLSAQSPLLGGVASVASAGSLDRRGSGAFPSSPSMSQSPSMGFRSFFGRGSTSSSAGGRHGSPAFPASPTFGQLPPSTPGMPSAHGHGDVDPLSSPMTTSVSQFSMLSLSGPQTPNLGSSSAAQPQMLQQPLPTYGGEKSADAGDEVRFVVELTKVKNLDRMYCVDIKRMKGGPWSYKHVYDQLLGGLELGPTV